MNRTETQDRQADTNASDRAVAVVLRHVAFEDAGTWGEVLEGHGFELRYLRAGVDALDAGAFAGADLLVILGGPIGVHDRDAYPFLDDQMRSIASWMSVGAPTLGICLGAQMIATVLGARVHPGAAPEFGFAPLSLTAAGRSSVLSALDGVPVLHWHSDVFELLDECVSLAQTEHCGAQAFTVGDHVLALQFHPEADPARIEEWLIGHAVELASHGVDPRTIRGDAARYGERLRTASTDMLRRWLRGLPRE